LRAGSRLIALLTAVLLASCGGSSDGGGGKGDFAKVFSNLNGHAGKERTRELVKLAKQEHGNLELYTSLSNDAAAGVAKAFQGRYGIPVSVYRGTGEVVLQRVQEEARAKHRGADVIDTNAQGLQGLADLGTLVVYRSPFVSDLLGDSYHRAWTMDRFNKFVVSWNSKRVPRGEQPRSWEDLADPRWRGKLVMEVGDFDWYKTLWEYWVKQKGKSKAEADRLFEAMARDASVVKGHQLMAQLLGTGEYSVAASNYSYQVDETTKKGAPIAWKPVVEPAISRPQGVGLVRSARHPARAVLFVDWLLGDGQSVMAKYAVDPARRDLATNSTTREIRVDVESVVAQRDEWMQRYDRLVGLGKNAGGGG
jgi:iron(III) transport system substrate-binding protein